jgi:predicted MFS family arabinose efflux permease
MSQKSGITDQRAKTAQFALMTIFFTQGFATLSWMPRIPEFIEHINVSKELWGTIIGFGGAGAILPLIFTSRLVVRFGTTPVIRYSSYALVAMLLAMPYPTQWWAFMILNFMLSFSVNVFNIALNSQAVMFQKRVDKVLLGSFHGSWSIGAASAATVSSVIAAFTPLKLQMFILPMICLILFQWALRHMLQPAESDAVDRDVPETRVSWLKTPKFVWLLAVCGFLGMWPELVVMDWASVFGREVLKLDASRAAWPYTIFVAAMIIGRFSIGKLTEKYDVVRLSQVGGLFGSVALGIAVFASANLAEANQGLALFVLCFFFALAGLGISSMVPGLFSVAGTVEGLSTAQALSRILLFNTIVVIFAKMLMGSLIDASSLPLAMIFPIATFAIAGVMSGMIAKTRKHTALNRDFIPSDS